MFPENDIAPEILGTIGTICWSALVLPQLWLNYRRKSIEGLSIYLMIMWTLCTLFSGVYNVVSKLNMALIVQPQIFGVLGSLCVVQCLYYGSKKSLRTCILIFICYNIFSAGFRVGFIYGFKHLIALNIPGARSGLRLFGATSSVLGAVAMLPQYYEIYRFKQVKGVSYLLLWLDMIGAAFFLFALGFRKKWDVVASLLYGSVIVLDIIVFVCAAILNPRARRREMLEKESQARSGSNGSREKPDEKREVLDLEAGGAESKSTSASASADNEESERKPKEISVV